MSGDRTCAEERNELHRRGDDIGMMRRADLWPVWPALPVKKPRWETGFLIEEGMTGIARPTVYRYAKGSAEIVKEYESLEALVDDGWRVD